MDETLLLSPDSYFLKDTVRVPLPTPRIAGLTRLLRELNVGESAVIPRKAANKDIYKLGVSLNKTFTVRALDGERSRVWRLK